MIVPMGDWPDMSMGKSRADSSKGRVVGDTVTWRNDEPNFGIVASAVPGVKLYSVDVLGERR